MASESAMRSLSDGKTHGSPVYETSRLGSVMRAPVIGISARDESPDHVESHASGLTTRPKPTAP